MFLLLLVGNFFPSSHPFRTPQENWPICCRTRLPPLVVTSQSKYPQIKLLNRQTTFIFIFSCNFLLSAGSLNYCIFLSTVNVAKWSKNLRVLHWLLLVYGSSCSGITKAVIMVIALCGIMVLVIFFLSFTAS